MICLEWVTTEKGNAYQVDEKRTQKIYNNCKAIVLQAKRATENTSEFYALNSLYACDFIHRTKNNCFKGEV